MDSESYDVLFKLGYWFDDDQSLELSVNRFQLSGNNDYINVAGDRERGIPAVSIRGTAPGEAPRNQALTTSLSYHHADLAGSEIGVQFYNQQFQGRYGASDSATFQNPSIAPVGTLLDQSQNESDKLGAKLTIGRDGLFGDRLKLTGGLDLLQDETRQVLLNTGREWVPETRFRNAARPLSAG